MHYSATGQFINNRENFTNVNNKRTVEGFINNLNNLTRNILGIGLAPIATRLASMGRSQSLS